MWSKTELRAMLKTFGRHNVFPSDGSKDEFVIVREDGRRQGIFKEWAPPILPFLSDYEVDEWRTKVSQQPAFLEKELRRAWRNSWLIDRDLAARFSAKPLPEYPERRVLELVGRLMQAFGLMAPFYHLEAMVDDLAWLGIDTSKDQSSRGELDVAAFLLPSALQQYVVATIGNWNGLDWLEIHRLTTLALADTSHAGVLLGLSGLLGVPPEHLIFAANALQWIPARVGGKKEDLAEHEAIRELREVIEKSREIKNLDCLSVLADMNARIRFFNWLPLIEGQKNFEGRNWTYASVCDTADELFSALDAHPELWQSDFQDAYREKLRSQILNLDAASAKGRFLLDLIMSEKRLASDIVSEKVKPYRYKRSGWLIANVTHELHQPCLVGTKPVGLALASYVLGKEHVLPGLAISTDDVESRCYKHFADAARAHWPDVKLWAIRSSSMDEGTARGMYETILQVKPAELDAAIERCIKSYNQGSAVAFRRAKGPNDQDCRVEIAVLLQPYQTGVCGGVATIASSSDGIQRQYQISVARTAEQVTSGGKTKEFEFSDRAQSPANLIPLVSVLERLHNVFGGVIQIEWVMDDVGKVIVLQMEFIPTELSEDDEDQGSDEKTVAVYINSPADINKTVTSFEDQRAEDASRLVLVIGPKIDPKSSQSELKRMVVRFGRRVREILFANPVSPCSHLANICRHFGIKLVS